MSSPACEHGATGRSAGATLLACAVAVLAGVGACAAAVLVPAPAAAIVPVLAVASGGPLLAGHAAAPVIASWQAGKADRLALRRLRSVLAGLPETEHPLGR